MKQIIYTLAGMMALFGVFFFGVMLGTGSRSTTLGSASSPIVVNYLGEVWCRSTATTTVATLEFTGDSASNGSTTVQAAGTKVLSANTGRTYARVGNTSNLLVTCALTTTSTNIYGTGVTLAPIATTTYNGSSHFTIPFQ